MPQDLSTQLARAHEHVVRGREIIVRQRTVIARIRGRQGDCEAAEGLLRTFISTLAIFEDDLARLSDRLGD